MNTISTKVAAWRTASGLKQVEAAAQVGVSATVFNRVENGTRFPDATTAKLFIAADVFTRDEWADAMLAGVNDSPAEQTA